MIAKCYVIVNAVMHEFADIQEGDVLCIMIDLNSDDNKIGIRNTRNKAMIYETDMRRLKSCFRFEQID